MSFTKASDLLLIALWTLTAAFLALVVAGVKQPGLIDAVDGYFRDQYLYEPPRRYARLVADYEKDNDHARLVRELIRMEKALAPVQKGDELVATKRVVYAQLVDVLVRNSQFEQARYWVERWLEFDQRDVTALLRKGRLLVIDPAMRNEGELLLGVLKQRFPESEVVADGRANAWASIGLLGRAFSEYVPFLTRGAAPAVPSTETFRTLMQPQFQSLIIEQLSSEGRTGDIEVYENFIART